MFKFNFPKVHSRYVLAQPWKCSIVADHVNAGFCSYFLSDGLGSGVYDSANNSAILPENTILEIIDFNLNRTIFNLIKLAGEDLQTNYFGMMSFWVNNRDLDKLFLKEESEINTASSS